MDWSSMTVADMRKYVAENEAADLFCALVKAPKIETEPEGERCFDAAWATYGLQLPTIQKAWSALDMAPPGMETFEAESDVEAMFFAVFMAAFQSGWVSATETK